MRASIVPRWNKCRRRIAIGLVGTLALAALAALRGDAPPFGADEPRFAAGAHQALWMDDFDDRPRARTSREPAVAGQLGRYLTLGGPFVRFDPEGGLDGTGAVRMDWNAARGSARCADDSRLLEAAFPPAPELFIQFHVRYTPGFVFDWSRHRRCAGNAKKLFLLWAQDGSRFVFISENGTLGIGSDHDHPLFQQNRAHAVTPAQLADGKWHRITFHVRQGSRPDRADGFVRGWIDGVQRWEHRGVVTHNGGGYVLFKLPATFNQGSPVAQSEWVDALRLWRPK
jgi:hypothetical protein